MMEMRAVVRASTPGRWRGFLWQVNLLRAPRGSVAGTAEPLHEQDHRQREDQSVDLRADDNGCRTGGAEIAIGADHESTGHCVTAHDVARVHEERDAARHAAVRARWGGSKIGPGGEAEGE